jgi:outer membrane autotransporter protein
MESRQKRKHLRGRSKAAVIVLAVIMTLMLASRQGAGKTIAAGTTENYPTVGELGISTGSAWIVDGTLNTTTPTYYIYFRTDLIISGTGTVTNAGLIYLNDKSGLDLGNHSSNSGTLNNSGTMTIESDASLTNSGTIANSSILANSGLITVTGGSLTQGAAATYSGTGSIIFDGGSGTLTNNQATPMNITSLTVNTGRTGTINGSGTTTLGTATVNGNLNWGGTITTRLTGSGTITGNVTNTGTIAPGNSIGTMTIAGNYTHAAGATYTVEANAAGQSDKLIVTGTATLNGGTVEVLAENGNYNMRTNYTILTAGTVVGTFANVTSNLAFLTPSLSYDPSNVYLLLTRNSTNFADVAGSSNQYAIASALDRTSPTATGDMADVINAVYGLSAPGARGAYDQMGGLSHVSLTGATFSSFNRYMDILSSRMGGLGSPGYRSSSAGQPPMLASRTGGIADVGTTLISALQATAAQNTTTPSFGLWVKGYGSLGERRGGDTSSRYDYDMAGIAAGFDRRIGQSVLLGMSLGYVHTNTDMKDLSDDGTISSYQGSLYGSFTKGPFYLNGIAAYGYNRYDTRRDISFGTITRRATARYDGETAGGSLEGGYRIVTDPIDIIPFASLRGVYLTRDGFRERNAAALALDADGDNASSLMSSLGMRFTKDYKVSSGTLTPEVSLKWDHEFINDDYVLNASFAGYPASTFTVKGDRPDRDSLGAGLALTYQTAANVYFCLAYDGAFSGDTTEHAGTAGIRYRW